jgi:phage terminase small subunit
MAGTKGHSGGARPNTGGARPGAGRKKKPPVLLPPSLAAEGEEPESLRQLRAIMRDVSLDAKLRLDAAKALAPYEAVRKGEVGKKVGQAAAAKTAAVGKFAPAAPPKLVAAGGKTL